MIFLIERHTMNIKNLIKLLSLTTITVLVLSGGLSNNTNSYAAVNKTPVSMNASANMTDNPFIDADTSRLFDLRVVRNSRLQSIVTTEDGSAVTYRLTPPNVCIGATFESIKLSFHVGAIGVGNGGNSHKVYSSLYDTTSAQSFSPIQGSVGSIASGGFNMIAVDSEPDIVNYSASLNSMPKFNGSNFNVGLMFFFEDEGSVEPDYVSDINIELTYDDSTCPPPADPGKGGSDNQTPTTTPNQAGQPSNNKNIQPPKTGELLVTLISIPITLLIVTYAYLVHHKKSILKNKSER